MIDLTLKLLGSLVTTLSPVKVYSVVPNDPTYPYVYATDFTSTEMKNKSGFSVRGSFNLIYVDSEENIGGSLQSALVAVASIKDKLQPSKGYTPLPLVVLLKLAYENRDMVLLNSKRLYRFGMTYEYEA